MKNKDIVNISQPYDEKWLYFLPLIVMQYSFIHNLKYISNMIH